MVMKRKMMMRMGMMSSYYGKGKGVSSSNSPTSSPDEPIPATACLTGPDVLVGGKPKGTTNPAVTECSLGVKNEDSGIDVINMATAINAGALATLDRSMFGYPSDSISK